MTTITKTVNGNHIIQTDYDHPNFISDSLKGAYWEPTSTTEPVNGSFITSHQPQETDNYQWKKVSLDLDYAADTIDPNANILIQLIGITDDLEESEPISEQIITSTFPFDTSTTIEFNLDNDMSNPNLVKVIGTAASGKIQCTLPVRWQYYTNAVLERLWLEGWSKRKPIPITGSTSGSIENYPHIISLTFDSDMQTDFSDIRFTDSDACSELDHYLVSKTDSTSAVYRVTRPLTQASPNIENIYAYYGNNTVTSASDGHDTFTYFDDFEDGLYTLRTDPYSDIYINAGTGSITNSSPIKDTYSFKHIGTGSPDNIGFKYANLSLTGYFLLRFDVKLTTQGTGTNTPYISLLYIQYTNYQNWLRIVTWYDGSNQKIGLQRNVAGTITTYGSTNLVTGGKWSTGTTYTFEIIRNLNTYYISKIIGGTTTLLLTVTGNPAFNSVFGMGCQQDTQAYWDNICCTDFNIGFNAKPSIGTIGAEESTQTVTVDTVSDEETQTITFTAPSDWTPSEPSSLLLTDLYGIETGTHETLVKPRDVLKIENHSPSSYQALRLKISVTGDSNLYLNINNINWVYEYLEDII